MIFEIFKNWQVIIISIAIIVLLPLIFYISSFDNRPVKIKKVRKKLKLDIGPVIEKEEPHEVDGDFEDNEQMEKDDGD